MKKKWMVYLLFILCIAVTVGPFLWMILTSFKTYEESIQIPPTIFPAQFTWGSYTTVLDKFPFFDFYVNTFLVLAFTIVLELALCSMAAYAFARLHFPGRDLIFVILLALLMVPGQIFLVPNYEIMVKLHLADTVTALWLPKIFSAFGTFMLREFFKTLPESLDEAAMLDGCGFFQIYYKILLPLLKPALASLAILTAVSTFKDLMWPLIVNNSMNKMTLSAGLAMLIGEHTTYYPQVMAGGIIAILPMIILFFIFQKQFVEGIATTGVKQ
ncbi:MAG: carbohydrate ABC transporter permease [Clostridia bacterium]|nr:carbohydrate ABC transporter permease [Clostridia bacterium]NCC42512.1 carbohydrate ABC transporter permease [Clostridia bacterium]